MSKTLIELLSVQFKFFLQQFFVNNLVVCPMYIQGFFVNHKFRHFWKVFRNFPEISGKITATKSENVFFSFVT